MKCRCLVLTLFVLLAGSPALGLETGDPAPKLEIARWISGDPVKDLDKPGERIHVIAFWATWSLPSTESLEQLSDLQQEFGNEVVFLAVSTESSEKVKQFLEDSPKKPIIRIAIDEDQKTTNAYMRASGNHAIPHVFVVDRRGRLAWQGHPGDVREVLEQILAGEFELEKQERNVESKGPIPDEELRAVGIALRAENYLEAVGLIDALLKKYPGAAEADLLQRQKFLLLYLELRDFTAAENYAHELIEEHPDDPEMLNNVAWALLAMGDFEKLDHRWPQLAHRAAHLAYEVSEGKDAAIVDTYARSKYLLGFVEQARDLQRKAVEMFRADIEQRTAEQSDPEMIEGLNQVLEDLEKALEYYEEILRIRKAQSAG